MKSKKTSDAMDQVHINTYKYQKTQDPLLNIYPRWKGSKCSSNKKQRKEVKDVLMPWMIDFVKNRLKWKKMAKYYHNDSRITLIQNFVGKHYPSVIWKDGKQIKKNIWYKPSNAGKLIIDTIKKDQPEFTEIEILNTLIDVIYKYHIDHYTIKLKPFKNTVPVKEDAVSLWDKISEKVQV